MYESTLMGPEWKVRDTITAQKGQPVKICEKVIPAGINLNLGRGRYDDRQRATGRAYILIKGSDGSELKGMIRFSAWTEANRPFKTMLEGRTERFKEGPKMSDREPLPFNALSFKRDQRLCIEFVADEDCTVDMTKSTIEVDVTYFE